MAGTVLIWSQTWAGDACTSMTFSTVRISRRLNSEDSNGPKTKGKNRMQAVVTLPTRCDRLLRAINPAITPPTEENARPTGKYIMMQIQPSMRNKIIAPQPPTTVNHGTNNQTTTHLCCRISAKKQGEKTTTRGR